MTHFMTKELNDSLDDIFGAPQGEVRTAVNAPADYVPGAAPLVSNKFKEPRQWTEKCRKCGGSGRYNATSTHGSRCFECDGVGTKTFRTSPEQRSKAKASSQARKAKTAQEIADAACAALKAADPVVYEWLLANVERNTFATDLWNKLRHYGALTGGQIDAVKRGIARDAERKVEAEARAAAAPTADTAGIDRLKLAFDTAIKNAQAKGRGLKMPRITIGGIVIKPAKATSSNPGALYVTERGEYLGKIQGGRFFGVRECTEAQEKKVLAFVADPKAAAIAYGIETGVCCICNATLTNKASIEAGIGPICSEKFGW